MEGLHVFGIDAGSVSVSVAALTPDKTVMKTAYEFHHGDVSGCLNNILKTQFNGLHAGAVAATTSTPLFVMADQKYDNRISAISGVRMHHGAVGSILIVGAEKFGLILFDENGNYRKFRSNTSCAAGTGSFLDQQASRLNLSSIEELCAIALENTGQIPKIASRCSVFAKTDLVHAQQEGYSLAGICDGLCFGLAKNIVDTLLTGADNPLEPMVFTGGVSRNQAVVRHIEKIINKQITVDQTGVYSAIGAACNYIDEQDFKIGYDKRDISTILGSQTRAESSFHPPLELSLSTHPDFEENSYLHPSDAPKTPDSVEVDVYEFLEGSQSLFLGIDIGSTSTKAVLADQDGAGIAGFYTRTSGRPLVAVQRIFSAIHDFAASRKIDLKILGAATTGSGRKFIGQIIGADLVLDEITAHALAACQLEPDVDTIIEIGGQDSKFTCVNNGTVTFSAMNTVCAAGTGSFVEEQANKLGCTLTDYPDRAMGKAAPVTSDRCTVFMERDINYFLSSGCRKNEMLASALHSVCENYLTKVASSNQIGVNVVFTGATAKNRALVAAFEQRLGRRIIVSRFCHLTGALGAALGLADSGVNGSNFKGIDLYKKTIPVESEVCELCNNHCKVTKATVNGQTSAFGFLCGRDYDTKRHVDGNRSGFDLLSARKKIFKFSPKTDSGPVIGIPAALHLYDDMTLWRDFFDELGIQTITSTGCKNAIKDGKPLCGAEFCAPMTALHGHANYLLSKADYVFIPFYLEKKQSAKKLRRQYCYYTQYAPSLAGAVGDRSRFLTPLVDYLYSSWHTKRQLYEMLKGIPGMGAGFTQVSKAFDNASARNKSHEQALSGIYDIHAHKDDLNVVLLGRPYTILSSAMNKNIPGIFASMGVKAFYSDMLSNSGKDLSQVRPLLDQIHWHYAAKTIEAAAIVGQTPGAYPVLVTSFRCSPDSFAVDCFKKVMESYDKPYLILQLDEHDSAVGYETRIEAAIRSFSNHHLGESKPASKSKPVLVRRLESSVDGKTLAIPNWDPITMPLVASVLNNRGIDARLIDDREVTITKSMRHNTGQCIPMNTMAEGFREFVQEQNLDPAQAVLWSPAGKWACNLGVFSLYLKNAITQMGGGMEKAGVYAGAPSFFDISRTAPLSVYLAYMLGGIVNRIGCKTRPYEIEKGATDKVIKHSLSILSEAFLNNSKKYEAAARVAALFESIPVARTNKPKAAILGDIYVVDNHVVNQNLVRFIEENGGEAVTTPYNSGLKMVAGAYFRRWLTEGLYANVFSSKGLLVTAKKMEQKYYRLFQNLLGGPEIEYDLSFSEIVKKYGMCRENAGESMDNIVKIHYLKKQYPDLALFVQTAPAFCCPSLVTEGMAERIEQVTEAPFVSVTYDGTGGVKNEGIIPYLKYPKSHCMGAEPGRYSL